MQQAEHLPTHGTLIEHYQTGILITGKSGIGKTECALSLLQLGAKFICDDAPLYKIEENKLIGYCNQDFYGKIHLRDLGIINLTDYYPDCIKSQTELKLIIELSNSQRSMEEIKPLYEKKYYQQVLYHLLTISNSRHRNLTLIIDLVIKQFRKAKKTYA